MPKYNPNSIWGSKKRPLRYGAETPASPRTAPQRPAAAAPPEEGFPGEEEEEEEGDRPKSHLLLWAILIFVAVIGAGTALLLYFRPPAAPNVGIGITKPDQVLVGDPFGFSLALSNYSSNILKNAEVAVTLPDNVSFVGQSPDQRVMQFGVGDIGPGSIYNLGCNNGASGSNCMNLIVTGSPNSVQHVDVKLTYATAASPNAQFETDGGADIVVGGPAVTLAVNAPAAIYSGQDFQFTVTYTNNTSHDFNNVSLALQYPPAFTFTGASMAPAGAGENTWNIGTIAAAGTGSITVTGDITGPENASYTLDGTLAGGVGGNTYPLTENSATLAIGQSPLTLSAAVNGKQDYIAAPGDNLTYTITYTNNSGVTFQNLVIKAALTGALFDLSSVMTDGYFSSLTNTVTWTPASDQALLSLAPGESGSVTLKVGTIASYPIRLVSDKDYTLDLNAQISSATVPPGVAASSTVSAVSVENKVGGAITLASEGFWRDASSSIANTGPYPPKVNQTTDYTIHWVITNYATDADNVAVSATLQSGTTCTGVVQSNMPTAPVCDPATGAVTWNIPFIAATTGITGPPAEAVFQVQNTPALNQVGNTVTLLTQTTLTATDGFTSSTLTAQAPAVTTDLPYDASIPPLTNRRVAQ